MSDERLRAFCEEVERDWGGNVATDVRAPTMVRDERFRVHIGARVAALAKPGEVLVSTTVKDLVAGSGCRSRIGELST